MIKLKESICTGYFDTNYSNLKEVIEELQEMVLRLQTEIAELRNKPMVVINNPPVVYPLGIGEVRC